MTNAHRGPAAGAPSWILALGLSTGCAVHPARRDHPEPRPRPDRGPDLVERGQRAVERGVERSGVVRQFYAPEPEDRWRGSLVLDLRRQVLEIDLRAGDDARCEVELRLADALDGTFVATTFDQLGAGELIVGGFDLASDEGRLARLCFDVERPGVAAFEDLWRGPELRTVGDLNGLPDGERVAVLDHLAGRVHVLDLRTRALHEIARAEDHPLLTRARYLIVRFPAGATSPRAALLMATRVSEAHYVGPLAGPALDLVDRDGDGVFEPIR